MKSELRSPQGSDAPNRRCVHPEVRRWGRRALVVLLPPLNAMCVFAAGASAASAPVSVFPIPGGKVAAPTTQITFRGVPARRIGLISVTGSRSGVHAGVIRSDSDGHGGSFVPRRPFVPGEVVTVRTALNILGGRQGMYRFTVARPRAWLPYAPLPRLTPTALNVLRFHSRPDLVPAAIQLIKAPSGTAPGDIFVAPQLGPVATGPMILSPTGRLIWFKPVAHPWVTDFRVQRLRGAPVLTWWQGSRVGAGNGVGVDVVYDTSYHQIAVVRAGNGLQADLHEFQLTREGEALITAYLPIVRDARSVHGSRHQLVLDSIVQEIDIKTGLVQFQWDSIDHVPLTDSYVKAPQNSRQPFDYFHVNSVDQDSDGNFVISARDTSAAYKVDRRTGRVIWTLGGKRSTFAMGPGAAFAFQHDVRVRSADDRRITVFDDGGGPPPARGISRGITLQLDLQHKTATLVRQLYHDPPLQAGHEGNMELLPNGDALLGWGEQPYFSEFNRHGQVVFDARFVGANSTYRAYRFPWAATPQARPAIVASVSGPDTSVYASWNGATDVTAWRILSGDTAAAIHPVSTSKATSFETSVTIASAPYVAAQALNATGDVVGESATVRTQEPLPTTSPPHAGKRMAVSPHVSRAHARQSRTTQAMQAQLVADGDRL